MMKRYCYAVVFILTLVSFLARSEEAGTILGELYGVPLAAVCDTPPLPLQPRLDNRNFPSVFSAWGGNLLGQTHLSDRERLALHDLYWCCLMWGHDFVSVGDGRVLREIVWDDPTADRDAYTNENPNMIFLASLDAIWEDIDTYPQDSSYWLRDNIGNIIKPGETLGLVNLSHPDVQKIIIERAVAVSKCGLYDGIFFDGWSEFHSERSGQLPGQIAILQGIRELVHENFLIVVNTNTWKAPRSAPYVNGLFLESPVPGDFRTSESLEEGLLLLEDTVRWAEVNLRQPRINALEFQALRDQPLDSPDNLRWMRAMTALGLTFTDGYVLFMTDDWKGVHNHWHYWYDFWDADLGQPVGEKSQLYQETEGLYIREFTNGWAVYNHSGSEQAITLPEKVQGVASGMVGAEHTLPNLDGEMYLRVKPVNPADVNGDGVVNILDLVVVAQGLGTGKPEADVNGDGVVNVFDLVQVAGAIGGGGAAPSAYSLDPSVISAADVERWLTDARGLGVGDANLQWGIRFLEGLLVALTPKETMLLPNYPNPFNPETWIPYRLAREVEVSITIYDTKGTLVRRLALGNQAAGYYAERGKAAYWDGRNELGEAVASGIYVYQFRAGDYASSRRMVIVK